MPGRILKRAGDVPARSLWTRIKDVALTDVTAIARAGAIQGSLEALEEVLLEADFGVPTTLRLVSEIEGQARRGFIKTQDEFLLALRKAIEASLRSGNSDPKVVRAEMAPTVFLIVGVNGAGKTTFIGKFSDFLKVNKMSVLVGAGDTFRAGAIDQLRSWAQRTGADFVGGNPGSDPASVAFDAVAMPTTPILPPRIDALDDEAGWLRANGLVLRNPALTNFLDRCSISIPAHRADEAPVGFMLMGETGGDERLFAVAAAIEAMLKE